VVTPAPHLVHVLGMHRSGTSAVTRAVNLLGASLGDDLMPPQAGDNPRGYWEHREVERLQQVFLQDLDRNWDDVRRIPDESWETDAAKGLVDALVAVMHAELSTQPFFALKDPRTCILGPIWERVQNRVGFQPAAVAVVRHPRSVIDSLARRSEIPGQLSLWLWWRHNLGWLELSRDMPRVVLVFEELVADPRAALHEILKLELPWRPEGIAEAAVSIEASAPRSTNFERPEDVDGPWWEASLDFYQALASGARIGRNLLSPGDEAEVRARMESLDPILDTVGFLVGSEIRHRWAFTRCHEKEQALRERFRASERERRRLDMKLKAIEGSGGYKALRRLQLLRRHLLSKN